MGRSDKEKADAVVTGSINTNYIYTTHQQVKTIVESYKSVNKEVAEITSTVKENWVGSGRNEFETQYKLLIGKIDDFGDTLQDIYDALVQAEADYQTGDNTLRQNYIAAMEG